MPAFHAIIADDHPLYRNALKQALEASFPGAMVAEAGNLNQAVESLRKAEACDLILLDLKMPGVQGFSGLMYLRAEHPAVPVVIVSASEEPQVIRRALALGASGYVPKSTPMEEMRQAFAAVINGDIWTPPGLATESADAAEIADLAKRLATLTPQQMRVLMMLREGLLNKQIAYQLTVSEATVKAHVSAILLKLDVDSRTQAVIAAAKLDGEVGAEI
ncbi:MAG: response regulator transcription factor [Rhizobiales bacterium]|nr:response regulator transcription factor [Hyphomicrobiales bacterium]